MSVEEGERVAGGNGGTQEPSGDEPLPLSLADDADNAEALQILIQAVLQGLWNDRVSISHNTQTVASEETLNIPVTLHSIRYYGEFNCYFIDNFHRSS